MAAITQRDFTRRPGGGEFAQNDADSALKECQVQASRTAPISANLGANKSLQAWAKTPGSRGE